MQSWVGAVDVMIQQINQLIVRGAAGETVFYGTNVPVRNQPGDISRLKHNLAKL